ncbi:MAG: transcriptional regulator [Gordonia sp. (in: high G+C Gram-positive bacteria)]|uniref:transcriptional regulator n=1 Tax=Gordonia sp. (in: high G+C Gram-positive bacteria) TaxID=84139 RepID=UPI003BB64155
MSPVRRAPKLPIHNRVGVLRAERGDNYSSLDLAFRICEVFGLPVEAVFARDHFTAMSTELQGIRRPKPAERTSDA